MNTKLTVEQKTLYYIAENMKMQKSISRDGYKHFQKAIRLLGLIPENATNGDVIKAMFPDCKLDNIGHDHYLKFKGNLFSMAVEKEWWDAPYKMEMDKVRKEYSEYAVEVYRKSDDSFSRQIDVYNTYEEAMACIKKAPYIDKDSEYFGILEIEYDEDGLEIGTERLEVALEELEAFPTEKAVSFCKAKALSLDASSKEEADEVNTEEEERDDR